LGLIDYGQVKRLTLKERICYAKLICALAREDRAAIVSAPLETCFGVVCAWFYDHTIAKLNRFTGEVGARRGQIEDGEDVGRQSLAHATGTPARTHRWQSILTPQNSFSTIAMTPT
jgi:hypothetical protein